MISLHLTKQMSEQTQQGVIAALSEAIVCILLIPLLIDPPKSDRWRSKRSRASSPRWQRRLRTSSTPTCRSRSSPRWASRSESRFLMADAMSHHFSLGCVQLDRQCALHCIGMLAGTMSGMFVGFQGLESAHGEPLPMFKFSNVSFLQSWTGTRRTCSTCSRRVKSTWRLFRRWPTRRCSRTTLTTSALVVQCAAVLCSAVRCRPVRMPLQSRSRGHLAVACRTGPLHKDPRLHCHKPPAHQRCRLNQLRQHGHQDVAVLSRCAPAHASSAMLCRRRWGLTHVDYFHRAGRLSWTA